jgi:hypothetical protein
VHRIDLITSEHVENDLERALLHLGFARIKPELTLRDARQVGSRPGKVISR